MRRQTTSRRWTLSTYFIMIFFSISLAPSALSAIDYYFPVIITAEDSRKNIALDYQNKLIADTARKLRQHSPPALGAVASSTPFFSHTNADGVIENFHLKFCALGDDGKGNKREYVSFDQQLILELDATTSDDFQSIFSKPVWWQRVAVKLYKWGASWNRQYDAYTAAVIRYAAIGKAAEASGYSFSDKEIATLTSIETGVYQAGEIFAYTSYPLVLILNDNNSLTISRGKDGIRLIQPKKNKVEVHNPNVYFLGIPVASGDQFVTANINWKREASSTVFHEAGHYFGLHHLHVNSQYNEDTYLLEGNDLRISTSKDSKCGTANEVWLKEGEIRDFDWLDVADDDYRVGDTFPPYKAISSSSTNGINYTGAQYRASECYTAYEHLVPDDERKTKFEAGMPYDRNYMSYHSLARRDYYGAAFSPDQRRVMAKSIKKAIEAARESGFDQFCK